MAKQHVITIDGSSTTASTSPVNWADKYHIQTVKTIDSYHNRAVSGSVLSDLVSRLSAVAGDYSDTSINILMMQIGANDLVPAELAASHGNSVTQWRDNVAIFLTNVKAARLGWLIGLTTLNPRDVTGFNTNRNIANPLIRAFEGSLCHFILDFAAHATYGVDGAAFNTNYYSDGTHPTDLVQQSMADTTLPIVDRLIDRVFLGRSS